MIFVYKDRIIQIEWSIFRGTSQMPEDFSRALVKLFLVGNYEKYAVPVTAGGGTLVAQMPQDLPDGAYSLEAIWVKNYNNLFPVRGTDTPSVGSRNIRYPGPCHNDYGMTHPWDHRSNDRCLMRSRKEYVFAVTSYPGEETAVNQDGYVTIKISSAVATYGYDGLSAYEIAVMRGDFNGTEKDFLAKNIINNPDNEDLTIAKEGGYDVIKFADKEYNALNHSGLGRVYLRKNIVSSINKNILTQDMIKKTNTRYIIQYDYDLGGEKITIPEGCVLDFQGGSFSNGIIVCTHTKINAGLYKIFNSNIRVEGDLDIISLYPEWFYNGEKDYSSAIQSCISLSKISTIYNNVNIVFSSGKNYSIGKPILIDTIRLNFIGNNCSLIKINSDTGNGTFTENENNIDLEVNCFFYSNINMYYINISDFNLLVLDEQLQNEVYGFFFPYINRSTIKNINSYYLYEGITTIDSWQNIFENIIFDYCSNCGFNISGGTSTFINKCWVTHSDTSYKISNLFYSILSCTASDFSKTSYDIQNCCITLNGCGCELTDNSYAIITNEARILLNNFFFTGDNNTDKEVFAFIGNSYIEFNNSEIRNTFKLLKCMESKVVLNNCKVSNWEIGFNSGTILRNENKNQLVFRGEFGNDWSIINFYNCYFSTENRPVLTNYDEGVEIYDFTLKKKILWNGSAWVNLDGTALE